MLKCFIKIGSLLNIKLPISIFFISMTIFAKKNIEILNEKCLSGESYSCVQLENICNQGKGKSCYLLAIKWGMNGSNELGLEYLKKGCELKHLPSCEKYLVMKSAISKENSDYNKRVKNLNLMLLESKVRERNVQMIINTSQERRDQNDHTMKMINNLFSK